MRVFAATSSIVTVPAIAGQGGVEEVWIDDGGLLHRGRQWVVLPDIDWSLMVPLLDQIGSVVRRDVLMRAAWPRFYALIMRQTAGVDRTDAHDTNFQNSREF